MHEQVKINQTKSRYMMGRYKKVTLKLKNRSNSSIYKEKKGKKVEAIR